MNIHPSPLTIPRKSSMKTTYVYPMTIALLVGALTLSGCSKTDSPPSAGKTAEKEHAEGEHAEAEKHEEKETGQSGVVKLAPEEMQAAGIKVEAVQNDAISDQLVLTATVRANQDRIAHVAPRVAARIVTVRANLGDRVKAGQILAVLDSIELGEAHSIYRQAQSQLKLAEADFNRAQRLRADEIIPEKEFLRARSEFEKACAATQAAADKLRLLDAAHQDSEPAQASIFNANAPFAGTVTEKAAVLGELAQPDKSIFTIADLSTLWIEANLFEKDLGRIKMGAPATVSVTAYPGEQFKGKLTYISSSVDKETRAVMARIEVPNQDGRLKPEMFATANISTQHIVKALTVPQEAVLLVGGQSTVFVKKSDGFEVRPIEVGDRNSNRVLVKGGLKAGEEVVIAGAYALKARLLKSQIGDSH